MKWDNFKDQGLNYIYIPPYIETDIECPNCGHKVYFNNTTVFTSNPVQYQYVCKHCGWADFSFTPWRSNMKEKNNERFN